MADSTQTYARNVHGVDPQHLVDEIVPIPEEAIAAAMRYCLDYEKVVLEGAGAASIAYVLESNDLSGKKIAAVCSGSNISKERLAAIFEQFGLS